jgi:DNA-binding PadR family transcriptional regulator
LTITAQYYNVVVMSSIANLGEFEQMVLLAILRLKDGAYGVSIREELLACARRPVSPGALYTTLDRIEKKGLVQAREGEPTLERGGRAKRFYTVTKQGLSQLVESQKAFHRLLSGLEILGEQHV